MTKIGMVSLGCSKNLVDSEEMLGLLKEAGFEIINSPDVADVIIVNTCGFITPAKEESINTILEMAQYKQNGKCKQLIVMGCLSQRYPNELKAEMPEVDLFWGVHDHEGLVNAIIALDGGKAQSCFNCARILTTPPYSAYLRIADGCDNRCTYCAIPLIRGGRVSVPMERLADEAQELASRGVKELTLIAQDTSAYGIDIYGKPMLKELMLKIAEIDSLVWIRVLYSYPNTVTRDLVDAMAANEKIVNYIDMPIQHIAPDMLNRMNRHGTREHICEITDYIRQKSDDFILRTTVMTGFPLESDSEYDELLYFMNEHPFDRVGAFAYSAEEGTPAALMSGQVDENIKAERLDKLMRIQSEISKRLNERRIGNIYDVLIDKTEGDTAWGRSYAEAPDVDGMIKIKLKNLEAKPGMFIKVKINKAGIYDLYGEEI